MLPQLTKHIILLNFLLLIPSGIFALDSLRFFAIGDMGGIDIEPYSTYFERCTAYEMGKLADSYSPQFIIELGDNFYFDGVKNVTDKRFYQTFESVYTAPSLQIPWYLVAGNHDHHGNVTAQILYSNHSKRWNFPDLFYYKEFLFANGKHSLGIVFIDTVVLCGNVHDDSNTQPSGPDNTLLAAKQWDFVQTSLKNSKADYLFVAGHYPVYSTAVHGPTKTLVQHLEPLLDKYQANGYFCGHDHNLQHLRVKSSKGKNIDYFVSGMANSVDPFSIHQDSVPAGSSLFSYGNLLSEGGFLYAEATSENMTLTFINGLGKNLYSTVVYPRKAVKKNN